MALDRINNITKARIGAQIEGDGSLPQELRRTRPLHYEHVCPVRFYNVRKAL